MKQCIIFFVLNFLNQITSIAQCQTDAGPDKFICNSGSVTIGPSSSSIGYNYSWSPTTGLSNPNIYNPSASPSSTTTYTLTMSQGNLLTNPGFENGDTGFGSDLTPCVQTSDTGNSKCVANAVVGSCTIYPHSGTKLLLTFSHLTSPTNYRVWYQTCNTTQFANYRFAGFASYGPSNGSGGIGGNGSSFEVRIIGNNSGAATSTFTPGVYCDNWQNFVINWNAGINTQVTIEIRFTAGSLHKAMNFDDFSFIEICGTDQVVVNKATSTPSITPTGPVTYYYWYEGTVQIPLTANKAGQWYKNNVAIPGATGTVYNATYSGNGTPTDTYKCENACGTSNVVTIYPIGCTTRAQYPVTLPPEVSCVSTAVTGWTVSQVNKGTNASYLWQFDDGQYWQVDNPYTRTVFFNLSGPLVPPPATDYVYTRALAAMGGSETRMRFGLGVTGGCRTYSFGNNNEPAQDTADIPETVVYPNPAAGNITIKSKRIITAVFITDAAGRRLQQISGNNNKQINISTGKLQSGIYYVETVTAGKGKLTKLVVNK